jgi:hypothetical protein
LPADGRISSRASSSTRRLRRADAGHRRRDIDLARDPRYVGSTVAVLHTWTQQLAFHPHVHCLVSGGGISEDGTTWHPARRKFLVPIKALARLVRGKFRALQRKCPDLPIPDEAWRKRWILHVSARGNGEQAVLDYLARYVFRVALHTNARIVGSVAAFRGEQG